MIRFLCALFSLLCILSLFLPFHAAGATAGTIVVSGLSSATKEELLNLLDLSPGMPIEKERIQRGIKRAFLKGIFEDISVETTDGEEATVTVRVRERDFIENIYLKGDYALSGKIIKHIFPLKEEQVMRYDILEDALETVRYEMAMRGFPDARVSAKTERLKKPYRVNIRLTVYTGEPLRIKKIEVPDVSREVKKSMKLSEGDIYDQIKVKKDLDRIKRYYKRNGYIKPAIGPHTFVEGILTIPVHPGSRLDIAMKGNHALSTKTLLKEMPFSEVEDFRDEIVEEAVNKMLSLYHKEGYPFAQIAPVITSSDGVIGLSFFIFEGSKVKVRKISFSGISLPEKNLESAMSLKEGAPYNPDLIETDKEKIIEFYYALGYLSAKVEDFQTQYEEGSRKMDISIKVKEGERTEIEKVDIVDTRLTSEETLREIIRIKPGDPYNEVDISDARFRIIEFYNNRGFPNVIISVKRKLEGQKASITFQIEERDVTFFGKTIVTGNYSTRYRVVEREFIHHEDMPFDYHILAKERQKLYKLGLFTDIDVEVPDRYDNKKDVLMRIKEGNAGAVEFGLGYGDYERFRGFFDVSYRNLWGMNRQASFRLELSSLEQRYILQYREPWFLDNPMPFRAFLYREEKREINIDTGETRYRYRKHGATAGIEKKLSETMRAELYYEFYIAEIFEVDPDVVLSREDTGTVAISGLRPGLVYDTRDNPFDPARGILSGISVKVTSPLLLSESNFVKFIFHGSTYHKLIRGLVLALSLRGGIAKGYHDTEELPIVERFFLGGRTTVRGYEQDTLGPKGPDGTPTGGNAFLLGNLELRKSLGRGLGIVTFLDGGNVWLRTGDVDITDLKYTVGLGLRYNTPVGPIRIDYGHKLQRENGESRGEIHFSIGHAF